MRIGSKRRRRQRQPRIAVAAHHVLRRALHHLERGIALEPLILGLDQADFAQGFGCELVRQQIARKLEARARAFAFGQAVQPRLSDVLMVPSTSLPGRLHCAKSRNDGSSLLSDTCTLGAAATPEPGESARPCGREKRTVSFRTAPWISSAYGITARPDALGSTINSTKRLGVSVPLPGSAGTARMRSPASRIVERQHAACAGQRGDQRHLALGALARRTRWARAGWCCRSRA